MQRFLMQSEEPTQFTSCVLEMFRRVMNNHKRLSLVFFTWLTDESYAVNFLPTGTSMTVKKT